MQGIFTNANFVSGAPLFITLLYQGPPKIRGAIPCVNAEEASATPRLSGVTAYPDLNILIKKSIASTFAALSISLPLFQPPPKDCKTEVKYTILFSNIIAGISCFAKISAAFITSSHVCGISSKPYFSQRSRLIIMQKGCALIGSPYNLSSIRKTSTLPSVYNDKSRTDSSSGIKYPLLIYSYIYVISHLTISGAVPAAICVGKLAKNSSDVAKTLRLILDISGTAVSIPLQAVSCAFTTLSIPHIPIVNSCCSSF